jgi:hypothetical protein
VKYLQILNAAVAVTGAVMGINLAVVVLLYALHVDDAPRLGADLPSLYALTGLFAALFAAGLAAFLAQRRRWAARWLLQALPVAPVAGLMIFLAGLKG